MALIDTVPTTRVTKPAFLAAYENGKLPSNIMRSWDEDGLMFLPVSYAFQGLYLAASNAGHHLRADSTGRYRSYERQVALLHERYVPYYVDGARDTNYVPAHFYNGKFYPAGTWWLKSGAMAATPGTSNHGWGLADDMASDANADNVGEFMSDALLTWMRDNAPKYGIGLETRSERWHWHWIGGNALSQTSVDTLTRNGVSVPDLSLYGFTVPAPSGGTPPPTTPPPTTPPPTTPTTPTTRTVTVQADMQYLEYTGTPPVFSKDTVRFQSLCNARATIHNGTPTEVLKLDGKYGPASAAVCRLIQTEEKITIDGECGNQTWTVLLER